MIRRLFDVTIIGADLSALMAGSLLVKRGFNVLIADVRESATGTRVGPFTLRRFTGILHGFGKDQIFNRIFAELGIPFLDKKRFSTSETAYQVVTPERRVDIQQDRDAFLLSMGHEFPGDAKKIHSLYQEIDRLTAGLRGILSQNFIYPPASLGERFSARKVLGSSPQALQDSWAIDFHDFLEDLGLSEEAKSFVDCQLQFLSPLYPIGTLLPFAAFWLGLSNAGISRVEGGTRTLEGLLKERIETYRGEIRVVPAVESVHFGKLTELHFAEDRETIKTRYILVTDDPGDFLSIHAPKSVKSDFKEKLERPAPPCHDFVLYLGIQDQVVPVGMESNLVLVADPGAKLIDDNLIMISLSDPLDESLAPAGKRLLAARVKIAPKSGVMDKETARGLAKGIVTQLRELIPFLDDFTEFAAVDESYALYEVERRRPWRWSIDDERLHLANLGYRTPQKNVYYGGGAVLPGLGFEGEAIAARTVSGIISEKLAKR